ncbi:hypothetical protein [Pedobacter sp. NJ-S-72]
MSNTLVGVVKVLTQLAGFLFISPQAVGKWERGEGLNNRSNIIKFAARMNNGAKGLCYPGRLFYKARISIDLKSL